MCVCVCVCVCVSGSKSDLSPCPLVSIFRFYRSSVIRRLYHILYKAWFTAPHANKQSFGAFLFLVAASLRFTGMKETPVVYIWTFNTDLLPLPLTHTLVAHKVKIMLLWDRLSRLRLRLRFHASSLLANPSGPSLENHKSSEAIWKSSVSQIWIFVHLLIYKNETRLHSKSTVY